MSLEGHQPLVLARHGARGIEHFGRRAGGGRDVMRCTWPISKLDGTSGGGLGDNAQG